MLLVCLEASVFTQLVDLKLYIQTTCSRVKGNLNSVVFFFRKYNKSTK